jgi:hypothetical protein
MDTWRAGVFEAVPIEEDLPYLSVVVTARNDDHGGNLLGRMQTFVNALIGQVKRHRLPLELVVVEWNPPPGRPPLAAALRWPEDFGPCQVRIVEVPPEVHRRYQHAEALPLYQMIAKNVGIRRARGRFILATNIDIIFSGELFEFLAQRRLESGKMYRIDRYDVMPDVPADAPLEEQLAYCQSHLLRLNAREGTFPLTPEGLRALFDDDIASPGSGVFFGPGWYAVERHFGQAFRWVGDESELTVEGSDAGPCVLAFEIEPGPGVGRKAFRLQVLDSSGALLGEARVERRSVLRLRLSAKRRQAFRFRVVGGGLKFALDPRVLSFRVFRCAREKAAPPAQPAGEGPAASFMLLRASRWRRLAELVAAPWRIGRRGVKFLGEWRRSTLPLRIGLPISPETIRKLLPRVEAGGASIMVPPGKRKSRLPAPATAAVNAGPSPPERGPAHLHAIACGDFTLMAREHWFDLRGYPEFDLYSFNLDSVLCYAAHYAGAREEILPDPLRIYHIEHAAGSGWTPEGEVRLFSRIAEQGIPCLDNHELMSWASLMQRFQVPLIFNRENWGLADFHLRQAVVGPGSGGRPPAGFIRED